MYFIFSKELETNINELTHALSRSEELVKQLRLQEEEYKKKYTRLEEVDLGPFASLFIPLGLR